MAEFVAAFAELLAHLLVAAIRLVVFVLELTVTGLSAALEWRLRPGASTASEQREPPECERIPDDG